MAVLIEGMEMPKDGSWVTLRVFPDGQCFLYSWCWNDDEIKFNFMEHLTAVPVPPHGRLIDADLLQKSIPNFGFGYRRIMRGVVDVAPTIIPETPKEE